MSTRASSVAAPVPSPAPILTPSTPPPPLPSSSPPPKPPSLEEVFASPTLQEAFRRFAESQHAEENFLFWIEVEAYRQIDGFQERQDRAKKIIDVSVATFHPLSHSHFFFLRDFWQWVRFTS